MTKDCDVPLGLFRINGLVAFSPNILHLLVSITGWWFQIFFYVHPYLGEDSHFDEHIFQRGWNHQPVNNQGFLRWSSWIFVEHFAMMNRSLRMDPSRA